MWALLTWRIDQNFVLTRMEWGSGIPFNYFKTSVSSIPFLCSWIYASKKFSCRSDLCLRGKLNFFLDSLPCPPQEYPKHYQSTSALEVQEGGASLMKQQRPLSWKEKDDTFCMNDTKMRKKVWPKFCADRFIIWRASMRMLNRYDLNFNSSCEIALNVFCSRRQTSSDN